MKKITEQDKVINEKNITNADILKNESSLLTELQNQIEFFKHDNLSKDKIISEL